MLGCWSRAAERLAPEAGHEVLVLRQVLGQQLHRHRALEHGVVGLEDRGHAAGPEAASRSRSGRRSPAGGHHRPPRSEAAAAAWSRPDSAHRRSRWSPHRRRGVVSSAGSVGVVSVSGGGRLGGSVSSAPRCRSPGGLDRVRSVSCLVLLLVALLIVELEQAVEALLQGVAHVLVDVVGQPVDGLLTVRCLDRPIWCRPRRPRGCRWRSGPPPSSAGLEGRRESAGMGAPSSSPPRPTAARPAATRATG